MPSSAHSRQHAEPVQFGQEEVQHDRVKIRRAVRDARQPRLAVGHQHDRMPVLAQAIGDEPGNLRIVFYDQNAHDRFGFTEGNMQAEMQVIILSPGQTPG